MNDMRAALYDRYGPPEVLYEGRLPVPDITPDQVLVRVHAVSVNGGEVAGRAGKIRVVTGRRFPQRTGIDFVGEIAKVGTGTSLNEKRANNRAGDRVGDRVWGFMGRTSLGSAAEYVAISPGRIAPAPAGLTPAEAVSLLAGGTTALTALRDKARLRPGERLLVRGGAGGVGSVAVQLGKGYGAHVTALASAAGADFVRGLGADEVLDYRTTRPADLGRFDVVLDTVGTEQRAYRGLLAPGGRMVAIAFDAARPLPSIAYILASTVHGPRRIRIFSGNPDRRLLAEVTERVETDGIRPVVDTVRPLSEIGAAHSALEAGGVRGKHIIQII
ncbi:NAD(P)-dependent alcohol dehydrogenase [Streptomyces paludis]|uniref:NAD(P)-dependent alcohol dehydrogenase n=1 Tax=Streptomyces paludis TaxID=2282738 RepID=A0A345HQV9_9ACTN|nr:NAD(P)-dependent alcohol dehydrogenase [Streptomyces paludis]AXG79083.1 NAD(P)-dependent alcohol dehydrogenase [Streptomyces paludis]